MLLASLQAKSPCHTTEAEETRWMASSPMIVSVAANREKAHQWFITILLDAKHAKTGGVLLPVSLPNYCIVYYLSSFEFLLQDFYKIMFLNFHFSKNYFDYFSLPL